MVGADNRRKIMLSRIPNFLSSAVDDFDRHWHKIVDDFFTPNSLGELKNKIKSNTGYPRLDVYTSKDEYGIQATVPGVQPENVTVETFEDRGVKYVKIAGQMSEEYHVDPGMPTVWQAKELCHRAFSRTVALPEGLEGDPEAKIKDGILWLTWKAPKQGESASPASKVIPIKTG
jgi:HSP20 family molecular chaperone IbpA